MNCDTIKYVLNLLSDCRAAAITCTEWYAAYLETPDARVWKDRDIKYMSPKMYPGVWKGSVYDLARAGNYGVVINTFGLIPADAMQIEYSMIELVKIAVEQGNAKILQWFHQQMVDDDFADVIGECGTGEIMDIFPQYAVRYVNAAVIMGNIPALKWLHLHGMTLAIRDEINEYPESVEVETIQFALENDIHINAHPDWLYRSVDVLTLCRRHQYNIPPSDNEALETLYINGNFDVIIWLCNNTPVDEHFRNITKENIHDVFLAGSSLNNRAYMMYNTPMDVIIRIVSKEDCYHLRKTLALMAYERKCQKLIAWLLSNGVSESQLVKYAQIIKGDYVWVQQPELAAKLAAVARKIPRDVNYYWDKFTKLCDTVGCDEATTSDVPLEIQRQILANRGRWDLIL